MNKRGQTAIFVILAIIIALIILSVFVFSNSDLEPFSLSSFSRDTQRIDAGIRDCFNEISVDAIEEVGIQGGYFYEPLSNYVKDDVFSIPFYYFGELEYIPSIELIEEQIAVNIDSKIGRCFDLFESSPYNYDYYYNLSKVSIKENSIELTNNLQLTLTKGDSATTIDFSKSKRGIKSNLNEMNKLASYIALSYSLNDESLCLSCFQEIAIDEQLFVEIDDSLNGLLVVNIIETRENVYPQDYTFALSATREPDISPALPEEYDDTTNDLTNSELNFNVANFQDE